MLNGGGSIKYLNKQVSRGVARSGLLYEPRLNRARGPGNGKYRK